ncbi:hypothetical protein R3W88_005781 [Solanum pinnatisectum]|uniref:SKP1-like protein n=1 Tax=Solanum pinnatisectum TaxID=50273 RepID=A0AAV9KEF6_9SOLN|nr:hypothetical protein R3W88_005781 [Solanum pinnatisectum]
MSSKKLVTLKTSDGGEFKLDEVVAVRSEVIKNIVQEVDCTSNVIPFLILLETFDVLLATNFLDDKQLKEVIIQEFADRIKEKPIEEICEVFGIVNDYTPEEEEEVRRENAWAFE